MSKRPITKQQAYKRWLRLSDDLRDFGGRLNEAGFLEAANDVAYIVDYCMDPIVDGLEMDQ